VIWRFGELRLYLVIGDSVIGFATYDLPFRIDNRHSNQQIKKSKTEI
jgi:hypothetical protein